MVNVPTSKPRIQITLDQLSYDRLRRYSKASGESMSEIVVGTMMPFLLELDTLSEYLEQAKAIEDQRKLGVAESVQKSSAEVREVLSKFLADVMINTIPDDFPEEGTGTPNCTNRGVDR